MFHRHYIHYSDFRGSSESLSLFETVTLLCSWGFQHAKDITMYVVLPLKHFYIIVSPWRNVSSLPMVNEWLYRWHHHHPSPFRFSHCIRIVCSATVVAWSRSSFKSVGCGWWLNQNRLVLTCLCFDIVTFSRRFDQTNCINVLKVYLSLSID